jgi:hypothetical protein
VKRDDFGILRGVAGVAPRADTGGGLSEDTRLRYRDIFGDDLVIESTSEEVTYEVNHHLLSTVDVACSPLMSNPIEMEARIED